MHRPLIAVSAALLLAGAAGCSSSSDDTSDGRAHGPTAGSPVPSGSAVAPGSARATAEGGSRPAADGIPGRSPGAAAGEVPATDGPRPSSAPPGVLYGADRLPAPAADRCRTQSLTAVVRGTGQGRASVVLTNTGDASCTVRGFPSLLFLGESGPTELPVDWTGSPADAPKLTLAPGASATAELTFTSLGECAPVTALDVVPPGESRPLRPAFTTADGKKAQVRICDTGVRVTPFAES
ncbi:DUF4232 domain-containing protein [Streptomyces sp. enrichment culture]|uniref:DUF4232 domain-containing protein n=1 Tax=Streptomyces sp. enrichment culture TaxID=1795815 RepID=UPI003F555620